MKVKKFNFELLGSPVFKTVIFAVIVVSLMLISTKQLGAVAPPNDLKANAQVLPVRSVVNPYYVTGTNVDANDEAVLPTPTCNFGPNIRDVWYKFTSPNANFVYIQLKNVTKNGNFRMQAIDSISNLQQNCYSMPNNAFINVPIEANKTYYLRLFDAEIDGFDTGSFDISITSPSVPALNVTLNVTPISCTGDSNGSITATPANGVGPYSYSWNTGQTTSTINNLGINTYTVTVTDFYGGTKSATHVMGYPDQLAIVDDSIAVIKNETCFGQSAIYRSADGILAVQATGGTGELTYSWDDDSFTVNDTLFGVIGGRTYTVTVTDENGCFITKSHTTPMKYAQNPVDVQVDIFTNQTTMEASIFLSGMNDLGDDEYFIVYNVSNNNNNNFVIRNIVDGETSFTISLPAYGSHPWELISTELLDPFGQCDQPYGGVPTGEIYFPPPPNCPPVNNVTADMNDGITHTERALDTINLSCVVSNNTNLEALSQGEIVFEPGFEVQIGSMLVAKQEDCPLQN